MASRADNDLQRLAIDRLRGRTDDLRPGLSRLSDKLNARADLLRNSLDSIQSDTIAAIEGLSVAMRQREQNAQATFDRTLAAISHRVLSNAAIFLAITMTASIVIALSIRLPTATDHERDGRDHGRRSRSQVQGIHARDEVGAMARAAEHSRTMQSPSRRPKTSCAPQRSARKMHSRSSAQLSRI